MNQIIEIMREGTISLEINERNLFQNWNFRMDHHFHEIILKSK